MGMAIAAFHYDIHLKNIELFHSLGLGDFTKAGVGEGPSEPPIGWQVCRPDFGSSSQPMSIQLFMATEEICNGAGSKGQGRAQVHVGGFDRCP